jgi:hypothetical protein
MTVKLCSFIKYKSERGQERVLHPLERHTDKDRQGNQT